MIWVIIALYILGAIGHGLGLYFFFNGFQFDNVPWWACLLVGLLWPLIDALIPVTFFFREKSPPRRDGDEGIR